MSPSTGSSWCCLGRSQVGGHQAGLLLQKKLCPWWTAPCAGLIPKNRETESESIWEENGNNAGGASWDWKCSAPLCQNWKGREIEKRSRLKISGVHCWEVVSKSCRQNDQQRNQSGSCNLFWLTIQPNGIGIKIGQSSPFSTDGWWLNPATHCHKTARGSNNNRASPRSRETALSCFDKSNHSRLCFGKV